MTKIKICGLRRIEDVKYVNEARPDYVGFVFWPKSKRNVSFEEAKSLRDALDPSIKAVGVFVNRDIEDIVYLTENGIIQGVQLHGSETVEDIEEIRRRCPEGTWILKAFEVKDESDMERAEKSPADMILVDAGKGAGVTFDWSVLSSLKRDYILAGGLGVGNVSDAVKSLNPFGVDVSSGVETDGFKDKIKIKEFCKAVAEADGRN